MITKEKLLQQLRICLKHESCGECPYSYAFRDEEFCADCDTILKRVLEFLERDDDNGMANN